ncbi:hypothetical protein EJB05_22802, partial [Eragrostis curvula]
MGLRRVGPSGADMTALAADGVPLRASPTMGLKREERGCCLAELPSIDASPIRSMHPTITQAFRESDKLRRPWSCGLSTRHSQLLLALAMRGLVQLRVCHWIYALLPFQHYPRQLASRPILGTQHPSPTSKSENVMVDCWSQAHMVDKWSREDVHGQVATTKRQHNLRRSERRRRSTCLAVRSSSQGFVFDGGTFRGVGHSGGSFLSSLLAYCIGIWTPRNLKAGKALQKSAKKEDTDLIEILPGKLENYEEK